ncbi:MAG: CHASE4 domain-containing protein [Planctomycetota bacterium]
MSLRSKIVLILSGVVLLFAGLDHAIQKTVVFDSFVRLEEDEAKKDLNRVLQALEGEIRHLDQRCDDWAAWDDTWRFVDKPNQEYITSNLGPEGFAKSQINLLYVCDAGNEDFVRVVWGRILDPDEDNRSITLRELPGEELSKSHALIQASGRPGGIWMTEQGPMLVSSRPILDSQRRGPSRGTVILGRFVSQAFVKELGDRTRVPFHVWPIESESLPPEERTVLDEVTASSEFVVREQDGEVLHVRTTFPDMKAAPALLIRADVKRNITGDGRTSVQYALISTVAAGLLILLVLLGLLQRTVLRPLAIVTRHAVEIGKSDETFRKLELQRTDEFGILSREFDRMMEKLSESRAANVKTARAAGMSEIATAVLHNVGNVLNSVNVSATIVAQRASHTDAADLLQAMKAVEESAGDLATFLSQDPRGKHLQPLLVSLAEQMAGDQAAIREEVKTLSEGIEHIQQLVRSQQDFAGRSGVLEAVDVAHPIESAFAMSARPAEGEFEIALEKNDVPMCRIDRHKLTEILVNLYRNAREAMIEAGDSRRCIVVRASRPEEGRLRIEVEDDGVGIPAENLERIFTHGFTTKKSGHGFGLHSSANAAREMGGTLVARSAGVGQGSTFILELPARAAQAAPLAEASA